MQQGVSTSWVVSAIGLWFGLPARWFSPVAKRLLFQRATGRIRIHDVMLISATYPTEHASRSFPRSQRPWAWTLFDNDSGPLGVPIRLVFQHRPRDDRNLAGQRNGRFLLASLLPTVDAVVGRSRPFVVSHADPGTLQQQRPQEPGTAFCYPAVAVRLARLILTWHKADVRRHLSRIIKAIHVVQRRHNRFSRPASDSRDGLNSLDAFVVFGDQVQTAFVVGLLLDK